MKTFPLALTNHYAQSRTTLADALWLGRGDGEVFGFSSADRDALIGGVTYYAHPGLDITSIAIAAGAAVGNLELNTLHDGSIFLTADILNGVWNNCKFRIFRYNFKDLAMPVDDLLVGTVGNVRLRKNLVTAELRDLRQIFQQNIGSLTSKTCRYEFGDAKCTKALGPETFTGTVTDVTDNQTFRDSARDEEDDKFGYGLFRFLTGDNAGAFRRVRAYTGTGTPAEQGTFALYQQYFAPVQVGDEYEVITGCRHRLEEDCRDKHNNVLNFGGEPHMSNLDSLSKPPEVSV